METTPQNQQRSGAGSPGMTCYASLVVAARVRYWEDATVNGVEDTDGRLIPHRRGDQWMVKIDLATGRIHDWPEGIEADIHYKVCDAGAYWLAGADGKSMAKWKGFYVPDDLLAGGNGYGDYIILKVDGYGAIEGWNPRIDPDDWQILSHNVQGDGRRESAPPSQPTSSPFHPPSCSMPNFDDDEKKSQNLRK